MVCMVKCDRFFFCCFEVGAGRRGVGTPRNVCCGGGGGGAARFPRFLTNYDQNRR